VEGSISTQAKRDHITQIREDSQSLIAMGATAGGNSGITQIARGDS
jgi:coenzyme F420-reducing hydrogenase gamma subunit